MRTSFNLRASRIGYTLVEMLVVLAAVSTLSALAVGVVARSRASTRGIRCLNNLRQISAGLVMHHEKYGTLPDPKERVLPAMLAEFISDEKLFVCPSSPYPTTDSYSQYYLPRVPLEETGFVLGCPNHVGEDMALAGFGMGSAMKGKTAPVSWNGNPIKAGETATGGTLKFADGTTVDIEDNFQVMIVTSFDEGHGKTYSAIRLPDGEIGSITVHAAHGTRFDVATPACTAGVRGTEFDVILSQPIGSYQTDIVVREGVVAVNQLWPVMAQTDLHAEESGTYIVPRQGGPYPLIVEWVIGSYWRVINRNDVGGTFTWKRILYDDYKSAGIGPNSSVVVSYSSTATSFTIDYVLDMPGFQDEMTVTGYKPDSGGDDGDD